MRKRNCLNDIRLCATTIVSYQRNHSTAVETSEEPWLQRSGVSSASEQGHPTSPGRLGPSGNVAPTTQNMYWLQCWSFTPPVLVMPRPNDNTDSTHSHQPTWRHSPIAPTHQRIPLFADQNYALPGTNNDYDLPDHSTRSFILP